MLHSTNPFTGEQLASRQTDSDHRIEEVLRSARLAFEHWRATPLEKRIACVQRLGELTTEQASKWAFQMALEMGKPVVQGKAEMLKCASLCRITCDRAAEWLANEDLSSDGRKAFVQHDPIGVVLGIMPWNFPFWQVYRFAIPTLLAGNTAILKHASNVSLCAAGAVELFKEAGFPEGVFDALFIPGNRATSLVADYRIAGVSLTGSEYAGSHVAAAAGKAIKPVVLELGGNNAFIVDHDADLNHAVETFIKARFLNSGQSCIAAKRLLLHNAIYADFLALLLDRMDELVVGDPTSPATFVGPLARVDLADELQSQFERSVNAGARCVKGGERNGALFQPTVLVDVEPGMAAFDEESFGPLAAITRFDHFESAIALSNASRFGLGVSVFSSSVDRVLAYAKAFNEGAVFINDLVYSDPELPFGGVKVSGIGRELARDGMLAFVNRKTVVVRL